MRTQKRTEKRIIAIAFLLLASVGIIICSSVFAFIDDQHYNFYTLIGGYISGSATILLGIIAYAQNRKYTVFVTKLSIKQEIISEKRISFDLFERLLNYALYTEMFRCLFNDNDYDRNLLLFRNKLEALKQELCSIACEFQLLKYIPQLVPKIVEKILFIQAFVGTKYEIVMGPFNGEVVSKLIKDVHKTILHFFDEMHPIRNASLAAYDALMETISGYKRIGDFENIEKKLSNDIAKTRGDINELIAKASAMYD